MRSGKGDGRGGTIDKKSLIILIVSVGMIALIGVGFYVYQTQRSEKASEEVLENIRDSDKEYAAKATEVLELVEELEQLDPASPEANALEEQIAGEMPSMVQKFDNYGKPILKSTAEMKKRLLKLGATPSK